MFLFSMEQFQPYPFIRPRFFHSIDFRILFAMDRMPMTAIFRNRRFLIPYFPTSL